MSFRAWIALILTLLAAGCGAPERSSDTDTTWVGTITTEGNVTTVVNESGSVWGGTARLVEEMSIGVDVGPPEYMFGQIASLAATDDRIYVLDTQPDVVRVYDYDGKHLFDIGREGEGPGEFFRVRRVAIDARERLIVQQQRRFSVFDLDGTFLETWPGDISSYLPVQLVATEEGHVYDPRRAIRGPRPPGRLLPRVEFVSVGPDGPIGDPLPAPDYGVVPHLSEGTFRARIPFWPVGVWALTRTGAFVMGIPDAYRFEIRHVDGRVTVVERFLDPVAVDPDEAAWHRTSATSRMRRRDPTWSWNGPQIPEHKPFYSAFTDDNLRRIWVSRLGPRIRIEDCDEDPAPGLPFQDARRCWTEEPSIDVFAADGRYLGDVRPMFSFPLSIIHGNNVFTRRLDEAGISVLKRYRLVLPEDQ